MNDLINPQSLFLKSTLTTIAILSSSFAISQPANAAFVSLVNPVIGGNSVGTAPFIIPGSTQNAILRCTNANNPLIPVGNVVPCAAVPGGGSITLSNVLQGQPGAPGGNVELNPAALSVIPSNNYDFTKFTSLSGTLNGQNFLVRSTTANDWFSNNNQLTRSFLTAALQTNGFAPKFLQEDNFNLLVDTFISRGGPQRFSDPNIAYVLADDVTGDLTLGMAGILNASNLLKEFFSGVVDPADIPDVVQVSEVAYVDYNNPGYFFASGGSGSFLFGTSGQSSNDFGAIPGCDGGGATGVSDFPEAGCSYSADFQINDITGLTPQNPILPPIVDPDTGTGTFPNQPVIGGQSLWFDPPIAVGYELVVTSGPDFSSIKLLPSLGSGAENNEYFLLGDEGGSCNNFVTPIGTAIGGVTFNFAPSVRCFAITGINESLGISSTNSTVPFPVELAFTETGEVTFTKTPILVPEPLTLLGASAAAGLGGYFKRRASKSRKG